MPASMIRRQQTPTNIQKEDAVLINSTDRKLDIIILAGQSNAEGYGIGPCDKPFCPDPRIMSMRDTDNYGYVVDNMTYDEFKISLPRRYLINLAEERQSTTGKIGCLALSFAEEYIKFILSPDRSILIIHSAVGATGFAKKHWGLEDVLYKRLVRMTELALGMNPENRVRAILWHQGEHETAHTTDVADEDLGAIHTCNFNNIFNDLRVRFGECPVLMGGFCEEWSEGCPKADIIRTATERSAVQLGNALLLSSRGLESNNTVFKNGDAIHFSHNSLSIFGRRYFEAYAKIIQANLCNKP